MVLPHCEITSNYQCSNDSSTWETPLTKSILNCEKFQTNQWGLLGNLTDTSIVTRYFYGNWTIYSYLPDCWNTLESVLCSLLWAPCRKNDLGRDFYSLRKLRTEDCQLMRQKCPLLPYVFQHFPSFVNCESNLYTQINCGHSRQLFIEPNINTFQCLSPALVTPHNHLWMPHTTFCGLPCQQLGNDRSIVSSSVIVLTYCVVQTLAFIFLNFATHKNTDFKAFKIFCALYALITFSISLSHIMDRSSWCDDVNGELFMFSIYQQWSTKFAYRVITAFCLCYFSIIQWFWMLLRVKYFPMSKCVAFGDKEYQSLAKPNKVKTINFVVFIFMSVLCAALYFSATLSPNVVTRLPQLAIDSSLFFAFEPIFIALVQMGVTLLVLLDAVRHQAFRSIFLVFTSVVLVTNFIRVFSFYHASTSSQLFLNFYFEDIWKCHLEASSVKICPTKMQSPAIYSHFCLLLIRLIDNVLIMFLIIFMLPWKTFPPLPSIITEIFTLPSFNWFKKNKPKVTILVSNQSSDGMVETFYSPSPSVNNFKDIQIVHLGSPNYKANSNFPKSPTSIANAIAVSRREKPTLVRAEITNTSSLPNNSQHDHQLANCPDCAKTIRVATWVNYLPQPLPRRKNFTPPDNVTHLAAPLNNTHGSHSSSNTFSPVYPLQVPRQFNNRSVVPVAASSLSQSVPGSPIFSQRSSSLGSHHQNMSSVRTPCNAADNNQLHVFSQNHRRILSQYNASPVVVRRKKPISPLVTNGVYTPDTAVIPTTTQSNPSTLRTPTSTDMITAYRPRDTRLVPNPTNHSNRISNSSASNSVRRGSDSFDSEEETRTEIGLCTSII